MNTLILGVGNLLLKDEGVGIHVISRLKKEEFPTNVDIMDGGTGGFHLTGRLQEYDRLIIIDATLDEYPPGTVRLIHPRFSSDFPPLMSAHEIGLKDMIEVMILTGKLPEIDLIVISVSNINDVSMDLSPEVELSIGRVIETIKNCVYNSIR